MTGFSIIRLEYSFPGPLGRFPPITGLKVSVERREVCIVFSLVCGNISFVKVTLWFSGSCRAQPYGTLAGGHNTARPTGANGTNPERNGVVEYSFRAECNVGKETFLLRSGVIGFIH